MKKFDFTNGIVEGTEWISRLAVLNLVWLLFSLPLVTAIPATNALFHILHLWSQGETSVPIFKTFHHYFKSHFWEGYKIGLPVFGISAILFLDSWYLASLSSPAAWIQVYKYVIYVASILFGLTALFYFPLTKKLTTSLPKKFLTGFVLMAGHPLISLGLFLISGVLLFVLLRWPALFFFFSVSGLGWIATIAVKTTFTKTLLKKIHSVQS
ncbi:YesL family protein [Desemzia sp. FAM 23991]|uniref:YesL family protein n=1 Tax=unclassified Desemzia TaxID=2685243 RepID=UPI003889F6BF